MIPVEQKNTLKVLRSPNLKLKSKHSWIVIPLLLIVIVPSSFQRVGLQLNESFKTFALFDPNNFITSLFHYESLNNKFLKFILLKFTSISTATFLPLFLLTIAEILRKKGNLRERFNLTSLGRVQYTEGYKGAEFWYLFLNIITGKFPILLTFLTVGYSSLISGATKGFSAWITKLSDIVFPSNINTFQLTILFILSILVTDLIGYINHWIHHNIGLFWDLHEFHHSATEMNIMCRNRVLPIESIFLDFLRLPFSVFLGLIIIKGLATGSTVILSIQIIHTALSLSADIFGHSSLKIIYPKPISYFIMSPACHWLHHSINPEHYNCNFGITYTFWDRIFGTYLDESHIENINGFGVVNTQYNKHHPIYSMYFLPLSKILRRFRKVH